MAIACPACGRQYDATLFEFGGSVACDCGEVLRPFELPAVEMPVEGDLDLHTFLPDEVHDLVPEYLQACRERGILRVRVVHGKGTGELLRTVHALLERMAEVESFELAEPCEGGWGATVVRLRPL